LELFYSSILYAGYKEFWEAFEGAISDQGRLILGAKTRNDITSLIKKEEAMPLFKLIGIDPRHHAGEAALLMHERIDASHECHAQR